MWYATINLAFGNFFFKVGVWTTSKSQKSFCVFLFSLSQKAETLIPDLADVQVENHWAGFRPETKKNIPFIQKDDNYENVFVNSGHFRYGLTMAPQSAEKLNEILIKSI